MTSPLLDGRDLHKSYGRIAVLHGVSLAIADQEAHVVIGPNGAGKTTLFKVLTGEAQANAGQVLVRGRDVGRLSAHQRVQLGFGRTFQVAKVFPRLSVQDNLRIALEARARRGGLWTGVLGGLSAAAARAVADDTQRLLADAGLAAQAALAAGTLAYGDRKRLELAMVLAQQPQVLFLDEPTAGMSAAERQATVQLLKTVQRGRKLAMLLTEHDMDVVFGLADRISVLHHGRLIASGTPQAIRADAKVREVYLGDDHGAASGDEHGEAPHA
jgi:branched-chain amino acid transport system ATP-binding protein